MGSPIIGRTHCPECGNKAAHVKRSEKCVYRHCPECGAMYHATGQAREAALLAKTRLVEPVQAADAGTVKATAGAAPTTTTSPDLKAPAPAPAPAKRRGLFS